MAPSHASHAGPEPLLPTGSRKTTGAQYTNAGRKGGNLLLPQSLIDNTGFVLAEAIIDRGWPPHRVSEPRMKQDA